MEKKRGIWEGAFPKDGAGKKHRRGRGVNKGTRVKEIQEIGLFQASHIRKELSRRDKNLSMPRTEHRNWGTGAQWTGGAKE